MTCQFLCTICKIKICLRCLVEKHSGHKLTLISARKDNEETNTDDPKCTEHSRVYKLYCSDCDRLVCLECVVRQHYAHSLGSIEEAYGYNLDILRGTLTDLDARLRLLRATQKTCRTLAQKTQIDAQKRRHELTTYFTRLREAVDKREAELGSELARREQQICQNYMTHTEGTTKKEKLVANATDDVRRLCTENKMKFLQNYSSTVERVSSLLSDENADCPPQSTGVDDVSLMTCSLEKELADIHWRWPKEELKPARKAPPVPATRKPKKPLSGQRPEPAPRLTENHSLPVGTAVKRGKSWKDGMCDGGPGHIGSITQICLDPDTYTVCWPNGRTGNYKYLPPYEEEICLP